SHICDPLRVSRLWYEGNWQNHRVEWALLPIPFWRPSGSTFVESANYRRPGPCDIHRQRLRVDRGNTVAIRNLPAMVRIALVRPNWDGAATGSWPMRHAIGRSVDGSATSTVLYFRDHRISGDRMPSVATGDIRLQQCDDKKFTLLLPLDVTFDYPGYVT